MGGMKAIIQGMGCGLPDCSCNNKKPKLSEVDKLKSQLEVAVWALEQTMHKDTPYQSVEMYASLRMARVSIYMDALAKIKALE